MEKPERECQSKECAFQRKEMEEFPSPCRHCIRNEKKEDKEGDFYVGQTSY